ncbi:MAG: M28 family peptidase [Bacteroidales bacterium]|nr:M28 family peptidase [Bacteroidales bacterium]
MNNNFKENITFVQSVKYAAFHINVFALILLLGAMLLPINKSCAQSHNASAYDHLTNPKTLKPHVIALTAAETHGRATGTSGSALVREYIKMKFEEYGVEKRGLMYDQPFQVKVTPPAREMTPPPTTITGHNIIGEIKATNGSQKYIIIGAHYDHLGEIKGKIYPGADDNASGIAALLDLANMFNRMKADGKEIGANLLFVAFDAKEQSMAGSRHFVRSLRIHNHNIICMINIDQIGSTLAPPRKNKNYLLVLGRDSLANWASTQLDICNRTSQINMDMDYTFYNSKNFYDIFYRLSDHYPFVEQGITALFFTSGITNNTYKETDTPATLSYPVMTNRVRLIFHFIYHLIS